MINIYVLNFEENGQRIFWGESLASKEAFAMGRIMAKLGKKPRVYRLSAQQVDVWSVIYCSGTKNLPISRAINASSPWPSSSERSVRKRIFLDRVSGLFFVQ